MLKAVLIDYQGGNIASAHNAMAKILPENMELMIAHDADTIKQADYIVLPGQGAFHDCMAGLQASDGLIEILHDRVVKQAVPYLGICVGMQIMLTESGEHCEADNAPWQGLGWLDGKITRLPQKDCASGKTLKIPQMGWNQIYYEDNAIENKTIFKNIPSNTHMYFVHSYGLVDINQNVWAVCDYGQKIAAIIGKDNMIGLQFHAEKSHDAGLQLIYNFLCWKP